MRLDLFPFRYRNPVTGKWVRARHRVEQHEIAQRFVEFEITGPAEIREVHQGARYFNPHFNLMMNAELRRFSARPPERQPHLATPPSIDAIEAFLVRLFLPVRHLLRQPAPVRSDERGGAAIRRSERGYRQRRSVVNVASRQR
jgi:hypothetical protein